MNLGKIDLYFDSNTENPVGAMADRGINLQIVKIGRLLFKSSSQEIDFLMAHELMHIKHNDFLKDLGFVCSKSFLYVIFLLSFPLFYSIPLILLTNGLASLFFDALSRRYEKQADEGALDFLQTSTGMIQFAYTELRRNLFVKYLSIEELKELYPKLSLERQALNISEITPIWNNRYNFSHPHLTDRLKMGLDFVPKAQISQ
jgi:Zn-dependent protease with chaperone function